MAMGFKKVLFIFIILVFVGFNFINQDTLSVPVDEGPMLFQAKFLYFDPDEVASFECEDFVSDALNNYTIESINQTYLGILNCTKESVVNRHDSAVVDTMYTFSNPGNQIQIYRAVENEFIFTFDVTNPNFTLPGNIRPGMTKEVFSRIFHITESTGNQVQIANNEASMWFMFYFENDLLKRINSYLYLD
jgi:hypothetical protein